MAEPDTTANSAPRPGKRKWAKLFLIVVLPLLLFACLVKLIALRMEATEWAMVHAVRSGDLAKVRWLLRIRPSLIKTPAEDFEKDGSVLLNAVETDDPEMIRLLVSRGADLKAAVSPLALAVAWGRMKAAEELLQCRAPIDGDCLCWAATSPFHEPEPLELLIRHGADVNVKDKAGYTALSFLVLRGGYGNRINLLLDHGADPNRDPNTLALAKQHCPSAVETLIAHGAK